MPGVHAAGESLTPQSKRGRVIQFAVDQRKDRSDARFSVAKILGAANHAVEGARLDHRRAHRLLSRNREQGTDGGAVRKSSAEFGSAEDRRYGRNVGGGIADQTAELRRAPDPAGVEQTRCFSGEAENSGSLEKKWPLLGEESLEHREIELGRIGFYLTEV